MESRRFLIHATQGEHRDHIHSHSASTGVTCAVHLPSRGHCPKRIHPSRLQRSVSRARWVSRGADQTARHLIEKSNLCGLGLVGTSLVLDHREPERKRATTPHTEPHEVVIGRALGQGRPGGRHISERTGSHKVATTRHMCEGPESNAPGASMASTQFALGYAWCLAPQT
jgi:hypothetical protein